MADGAVNLFGEHEIKLVESVADMVGEIVGGAGFVAVVAGEEDFLGDGDDADDDLGFGQGGAVEMVDFGEGVAGGDDGADDFGQGAVAFLTLGQGGELVGGERKFAGGADDGLRLGGGRFRIFFSSGHK